jgi:hypothetical protein
VLLIVIYIATFTARTLRNNACPRRGCTHQVKIHHYTSYYMHYNYFATQHQAATSRVSVETERQPIPDGQILFYWESTTPPLPGSHSAITFSHLLCKISLTYYIPWRDADRVSQLDTKGLLKPPEDRNTSAEDTTFARRNRSHTSVTLLQTRYHKQYTTIGEPIFILWVDVVEERQQSTTGHRHHPVQHRTLASQKQHLAIAGLIHNRITRSFAHRLISIRTR